MCQGNSPTAQALQAVVPGVAAVSEVLMQAAPLLLGSGDADHQLHNSNA
jgi:hypothetical protein